MSQLPSTTLGNPVKQDKGTQYWAQKSLFNITQLKRNRMIVEINALQQKQHERALRVIAQADDSDGAADELGEIYSRHAAQTLAELWQLVDDLMFKYADGYINEVTPQGTLRVTTEPYPDWWLKDV